jgi:hypothetical protein
MPGPIEKFQLIKQHGGALREAGYEPQRMSCAELHDAIRTLANCAHRDDGRGRCVDCGAFLPSRFG